MTDIGYKVVSNNEYGLTSVFNHECGVKYILDDWCDLSTFVNYLFVFENLEFAIDWISKLNNAHLLEIYKCKYYRADSNQIGTHWLYLDTTIPNGTAFAFNVKLLNKI